MRERRLVIFSDTLKLNLFASVGIQYYWRRVWVGFIEKDVRRVVTHGGENSVP